MSFWQTLSVGRSTTVQQTRSEVVIMSIPNVMGTSSTNTPISLNFSEADANKNKVLSEKEFIDQLTRQNPGMSPDEVNRARISFQNMAGSDGLISEDEAAFLVGAINHGINIPKGFDFTAIDTDHNNSISQDEWGRFITNSSSSAAVKRHDLAMFYNIAGSDGKISRSDFYNVDNYTKSTSVGSTSDGGKLPK
jgi:Ca2+-binding EF-hand superfamily protein